MAGYKFLVSHQLYLLIYISIAISSNVTDFSLKGLRDLLPFKVGIWQKMNSKSKDKEGRRSFLRRVSLGDTSAGETSRYIYCGILHTYLIQISFIFKFFWPSEKTYTFPLIKKRMPTLLVNIALCSRLNNASPKYVHITISKNGNLTKHGKGGFWHKM